MRMNGASSCSGVSLATGNFGPMRAAYNKVGKFIRKDINYDFILTISGNLLYRVSSSIHLSALSG